MCLFVIVAHETLQFLMPGYKDDVSNQPAQVDDCTSTGSRALIIPVVVLLSYKAFCIVLPITSLQSTV